MKWYIWNESYMNCGYEIKWSYDLRSYERNFCNCGEKSEKFRTSTGFEPVTLRFRCDTLTNWAMKPLTLGAGHLWVLMVPWGMNQWWNGIYEMNHIWTADMKLISTIHVDALDTEKPKENHATKKQNLTWTESTCTCTVLVHIAYSVCYSTVRVKCSSFYICFSKRLCKK